MNKTLAILLIGLSLLTGCPGPATPPPETPTSTKAGGQIELGGTSSFLALASACSGAPISYSYSGTTVPGYSPSRDGQVTAQGAFTAPVCGSPLLGSTVTVVGSCLSGSIPHTAVASITVGAELVDAVTIIAADVSICGAAVCRAVNPLNISTPPCDSATPTTIQFYARIDASCDSVIAPSDPVLVVPLPPACP